MEKSDISVWFGRRISFFLCHVGESLTIIFRARKDFFSSHSPHDDDVAHTQHSTSRIIIIHILFWRAELTSAYCSVIQRRRHESSEYVGGGGFQTFDETNRGHWFIFFRGESFQLLLSMQFPERRMSGSLCAEVRAGKLPRKTLSLVVVYGAAQYLLNENRRCG